MILLESERPLAIKRAKEWMLDPETEVLEAHPRGGVALQNGNDILVITPNFVEWRKVTA